METSQRVSAGCGAKICHVLLSWSVPPAPMSPGHESEEGGDG